MIYDNFPQRLTKIFNNIRYSCDKDQWEKMREDAEKFKDQSQGKSAIEQYRMFREQFGDIDNYIFLYEIKNLLEKTNGYLRFFKILTVIWIILAVIAVLQYLQNSPL